MKYRKTALIEAEQYREGLEDGIYLFSCIQ
jgi:hypothetical protein